MNIIVNRSGISAQSASCMYEMNDYPKNLAHIRAKKVAEEEGTYLPCPSVTSTTT